jgi:dCTP diphosphatase
MPDSSTTVAELARAVAHFVAEREWERFHSPKNLAMALAVEAAELMEPFLWIDETASRTVGEDPVRKEALADEIADVACLLLGLCRGLGIDLSEAVMRKLSKNALKYPVDKCRGHYGVRE